MKMRIVVLAAFTALTGIGCSLEAMERPPVGGEAFTVMKDNLTKYLKQIAEAGSRAKTDPILKQATKYYDDQLPQYSKTDKIATDKQKPKRTLPEYVADVKKALAKKVTDTFPAAVQPPAGEPVFPANEWQAVQDALAKVAGSAKTAKPAWAQRFYDDSVKSIKAGAGMR